MNILSDMEFVQKYTPLDFQVKNFTTSILPNFNSFSKKKTQKMEKFTPLAKILHCRRHWRDGQIPPLQKINVIVAQKRKQANKQEEVDMDIWDKHYGGKGGGGDKYEPELGEEGNSRMK